jgi:prepilin-type N-terminal cleavage/methylation domain-containing protein
VKNLKIAVLTEHGFTLLEILVALTVFSLVIVSATGVLISIRSSWLKQKAAVDIIQHSRWAMEFTCNELRQGSSPQVGVAGVTQTVGFLITPDIKVWYWRGIQAGAWDYGSPSILYRGIDGPGIAASALQSFQNANGNREEITGFIVDNTSGNNIFTLAGGLCTLELTLRPNPGSPVGTGNRNFTLKSQVRAKN